MIEQAYKIVKIPITEIEAWLREKYSLPSSLTDIRLEDKTLIISFTEKENPLKEVDSHQPNKTTSKRRSSKKRNRMKTRGWLTVARINNSKGQQCTIYKPFVDALEKPNLTHEEQKQLVEKILRSNKNKPSEESIQYYLENTLKYLQGGKIENVTLSSRARFGATLNGAEA
jgi:superfamily II RNA helicase